MHKCIPYAKSGALPLNEPGRLLERAECINAFPTKDPCKFQFDGAFRPVTFLPGYVERKNIGHHRRASHPPYEHAETFSVQRNMDGNRSFGTDESVPYEHTGTYPVNETWMVTNLSERMNPFPTNTPEHFSSNKPYIF